MDHQLHVFTLRLRPSIPMLVLAMAGFTLWLLVERSIAAEAEAKSVPVLVQRELTEPNQTFSAIMYQATEIGFRADTQAGDSFLDAELNVIFMEPSGASLRVPAFWAGGNEWKVRYAPRSAGRHTFRLEIAAGKIKPAHEVAGTLQVRPYEGENPLLKHGPVHLSQNHRYFAHADGMPFFWLADSWWHGITSRLTWGGFKTLVADRRQKGFNVIQFAVAFPCDIAPFDDRGGNEAGHAWEKDFKTINPAYWDLTDKRIVHLIENGIMPNIVGSWGYYINFMGEEKMKKHWRYVVARYGAFPVAWTICGESRLPWYPNIGKGDQGYQQTLKWTEVGRYLRENNSFQRLIGIHPGPPLWFNNAAYEALSDYSIVDIYFGMGGHGGGNEYAQVLQCLKTMDKFRANNPGKVSIIGELCWEGMYGGNCGPFVQRIQFWGAVLNGAPGHCYGTDSLWQMNTREKPFGPSVTGSTWGNWPWEEAYQWLGSTHVSIGKRILEKYEWWRFEPHPEWLSQIEEKDAQALVAAAAGIPGGIRVFYFAKKAKQRLLHLEPGRKYQAIFISPIDGREYPREHLLEGDGQGACDAPRGPINQDWVLVLRPQK